VGVEVLVGVRVGVSVGVAGIKVELSLLVRSGLPPSGAADTICAPRPH
jgi:hypothetical protein